MAQFLDPLPKEVSVEFTDPRSNHITASGLASASYKSYGLWRGSLRFSPTVRGENNYIATLLRADAPNRGFFLDIQDSDYYALDNAGALQEPIWITQAGDISRGGLDLAAGHNVQVGNRISFRQSSLPDFVTARHIVEVDGNHVLLDAEIPQEYFVTSPATNFQYCINRPHIRARFTESPLAWRKENSAIVRMESAKWIEDSAAIIFALRSISGVSGVEPDTFVTQQGIPFVTESGSDTFETEKSYAV